MLQKLICKVLRKQSLYVSSWRRLAYNCVIADQMLCTVSRESKLTNVDVMFTTLHHMHHILVVCYWSAYT